MDFFEEIKFNILKYIYFEDQNYVRNMLTKEAILSGLEHDKYYSFVYRLLIDRKPTYHKLRAIKKTLNDRNYILVGIRNIDKEYRKEIENTEKITEMRQKEQNHLEAVLSSAAGYLEANLSLDKITEMSPFITSGSIAAERRFPDRDTPVKFSMLEDWMCTHLVITNREKYKKISSRDFLLNSFLSGERRASVLFSIITKEGQFLPCRKVFYLYQNSVSGDVMVFAVIYDLTEQQRRDQEMRALEEELKLSRIRNSTSQMQPHFLYNVLGSIQEIIHEDPEYASDVIDNLTIHLRSCVRAMENDNTIPFSQELANIKAYVNIEEMRLGEKLHVIYEIGPDDFPIIPLSIQPIVENAIRHGVFERGDEGGMVIIRTIEKEDSWIITVDDTGVGFDVDSLNTILNSPEGTSTGLKNLIFRLEKLMGAEVSFESDIGSGTTVKIMIRKDFNKEISNERDYS